VEEDLPDAYEVSWEGKTTLYGMTPLRIGLALSGAGSVIFAYFVVGEWLSLAFIAYYVILSNSDI